MRLVLQLNKSNVFYTRSQLAEWEILELTFWPKETSVVVVDESYFIAPLRSYPEEVNNEETFFLRTAGNCLYTFEISGPEKPNRNWF